MSGSPRSGSRTRFSTPEPDLDDHRNQPEALPRADTTQQRSRRGTLASLQDETNPALAPRTPLAQFLSPGMIARDFEHEQAVADDDASIRSGHNPIVARRSTYRRPTIDPARRSHESSRSRSSSPPNSVDAFAGPQRRRRAGTITSQCSVGNLSIQRTLSDGTRGRRRPTFSDARTPEIRGDEKSISSSVVDDVCFPPEENNKPFTIDFEELDEFVAQPQKKTPVAHPFATHANQSKLSVCHDMRNKLAKASPCDSGRFSSDADEKAGVDDDPKRLESLRTDFNHSKIQQVKSAPQSRWTFFSSEADETIHSSELGGLIMPGESFRDLFELGPEGGVWWLDMVNPSQEEVAVICKACGIHPLTREDIETQETREKVELFKQYYFVCFRSFYQEDKQSDNYLDPINVYAVVFREGLLTFSFCNNQHAPNVRKRIGRLRDYVNLSADWICYALIDEIIDAFAPIIHDIEHESDEIEDNVFISRVEDASDILRQIGNCRKRVMQLSRLLSGKADVIKGFAKRCNEQYSVAPRGDVGLYLSDVQDHVVTMMSNLAHFEKMLSRSHSNYLAQVSMQNVTQGNKANQMLNKITVLATILVPLNLVAGLFGMNVNVPGKSADGLGWFFGIIGVMLAFSITAMTVARRMRFI
ncbi:cora-domain-containing protein [Myriangium duriaei CBS 260.36]|uniref:Cora-domain-containing protein n=1 Tax=Myriangium duriaei CBS 260.36 TaxID=1168546 RepID=A0A9P4JAK1_9PEZI|nr:cora-domain-containing protein [Myriangium duriaei CBS 260.36]